MCLSIPARIESIEGGMAVCSVGQSTYNTSLDLISEEDLKVGDYLLIHTGFALQKLDTEEANSILATFEEFKKLNDNLDKEELKQNKRIV
ncbi:MAG: HypC/HybG/HupF family hydrogenase formation chaperone [Lentimicrobiaceae bacterium]|jgi:hydrogenase expression/formation protein HypC|nr:HypC/HybG/HupF family hydrogenase formation chaperone [Lentimicrobiaceae bacterium]MCP4909893.1 HypC/HybG/HupF family hydrogenase formation chaperone [Bacteroidota bacterium]MBT3453702.1 HypC/HybG/HupF family hydrogenase formation chaperone [Lentimicrobiaceae bacterium]MBT3818213.1 HypC/HybG/HupF family hydrogenase formation chaperone [Lentimicrobiaceae bacterium]MBT4061759.1 HypC/HybG/HupF family hydrogenase formation chaperone [Lentimicrobiaceae bacterium]